MVTVFSMKSFFNRETLKEEQDKLKGTRYQNKEDWQKFIEVDNRRLKRKQKQIKEYELLKDNL